MTARSPLHHGGLRTAVRRRLHAPATSTRTAALCVLTVACIALGGCALVDKPVRAVVYDFGPGMLGATGAGVVPSLAVLALPEVESGAAFDSTAVLYRLLYADGQQLMPYAQARWSMTPAQLVRQRLRETLGQHRTVLNAGEGMMTGSASLVLRVDLEEFSQLFDAPDHSVGLVRLRATLVRGVDGGERLLGQRSFVVQRAAPSPDAAGGVRALTAATDASAVEIEQWLSQFR